MLSESSHPGYQFDLIKFTMVLEHKILNKMILKCNYTHVIISMDKVEEKEKSYSS